MTPYSAQEGYKLVRRFRVEATRRNLFWGLKADRSATLDVLLDQNLQPGEAAGSLTITEHYTFVDAFLDFLSIGIYRPYTVVIEGEAYQKASAPVTPPASGRVDAPAAKTGAAQ